MTEKNQTIEIIQGDTKQITIPVTDEAGVAKDITGSTQRWAAYDSAGTAKISKADVDISLVKVNGAAGELDALRFTLAPSDTSSLAPDTYIHEAEVVDASSNVATVTTGALVVIKQRLV